MTTMTFSTRDLNPHADADLLFGWLSQPRAKFWGMVDKPRDEVVEIYTWIQQQPHLSAHLVELNGVPVALLQTWDPAVDEVGASYPRRDGDLGVHLFVARVPGLAGLAEELFGHLRSWLLARQGLRRLVAEPDVENRASLAMLTRFGFTFGPRVQLPGKVAQFAFLEV